MNTQTGFSVMLWCLHFWRYLKPDGTQSWETCSSWLIFEQELRLGNLQRCLPASTFLWFCENIILICSTSCLNFESVTLETWKQKSTLNALSKLLEALTLPIRCLRDADSWITFLAAPHCLWSPPLASIFHRFWYREFYQSVILWRLYHSQALLAMSVR